MPHEYNKGDFQGSFYKQCLTTISKTYDFRMVVKQYKQPRVKVIQHICRFYNRENTE